jgi:hypothetical protein
MKRAIAVMVFCVWGAFPAESRAFCGFYVSGEDASLHNDATMVVIMREGTRTVLSMQNNYQGPPQDFAMVVPVPVVLQEENVKTLPREIFARLDKLAAPRLVEYWEQDPCFQYAVMEAASADMARPASKSAGRSRVKEEELGVTIEAQFEVAEYDIVILSAKDSSGLDRWLRQNDYRIPKGAEKLLRPYVEQNTKFFVAKVDVDKVRFVDGKAVLSPLRFHYDSPKFSLPVRLGLLNSAGQQDLLVHILAKGQRYELANYANATIPTNIVVRDAVRRDFGRFYDALFEKTVEKNPGAVVTEYAWDATSCDPCPEPPLTMSELLSLGADVIVPSPPDPYADIEGVVPRRSRPVRWQPDGFVLTRLHYRYGKNGLGEDLLFRTAGPIIGGRGMPDTRGELAERKAQPSGMNNFQGRYVILHRWEGPIECSNPQRGNWGGPPDGGSPRPVPASNPRMQTGKSPSSTAAFRGALPALIQTDVPELSLEADPKAFERQNAPGSDTKGAGGDGCSLSLARQYGPQPWAGWIGLIIVAMWLARRRAHG